MRVRRATPADARAIAIVHRDSWHTTYRGIVPDSYLDGMDPEARVPQLEAQLIGEAPPRVTFVVEDEMGRIVGFARVGPEREGIEGVDGEIYAIYLLREAQRKGTGTLLFETARTFLAEHDLRSILVWVLTDNPSCRFYEARGGKEIARKMIRIGGAELEEMAYRFD